MFIIFRRNTPSLDGCCTVFIVSWKMLYFLDESFSNREIHFRRYFVFISQKGSRVIASIRHFELLFKSDDPEIHIFWIFHQSEISRILWIFLKHFNRLRRLRREDQIHQVPDIPWGTGWIPTMTSVSNNHPFAKPRKWRSGSREGFTGSDSQDQSYLASKFD